MCIFFGSFQVHRILDTVLLTFRSSLSYEALGKLYICCVEYFGGFSLVALRIQNVICLRMGSVSRKREEAMVTTFMGEIRNEEN